MCPVKNYLELIIILILECIKSSQIVILTLECVTSSYNNLLMYQNFKIVHDRALC